MRAGPFGCHILAEFTVPPALLLRDRKILLRFTAVTPERKGSTRAPVLRRGGRTDRGLAPSVDRVKSAGVMQIHRPLLFWMNGVIKKALSDLRSLGAKG